MKEKLGLYLHIPFCEKKCPYCAFNSYGTGRVPEGYVDRLVDELLWSAELLRLKEREVDTVYFGGGTPSLLAPEEVSRIMATLKGNFDVSTHAEVTFEANPASAGKGGRGYLAAIREAGVNRLSLGVQSFSDESLKLLGRVHNAKAAEEAIKNARKAGFHNLSIDLIFGLPGQGEKAVTSDIEKALSYEPEHLSLYLLGIEEGTPFESRYAAFSSCGEQEETNRTLYLAAGARLEGAGYMRYETSNFARGGFHSRHNMKYWNGGDYLGAGAGAHSYLSGIGWGVRWWGVRDPALYRGRLEGGWLPVEDLELLDRTGALREAVMTALRRREGLDGAGLKDRFGLSLRDLLGGGVLERIPPQFYKLEGERLSLTGEGVLLADEIAAIITP